MENQQATSRTHPLIITASVAVILLCIAGLAAIMGWIPKSGADSTAAEKTAAAAEKPASEAKTPAARATSKSHTATASGSHPLQVAAAPSAPKAICKECGVIEQVAEREKAGEASGVGAVGGGVLGGVLGHQVGGGRGRDVATVVGAVGGAVAGHEIEKNLKKSKFYETTVRFEDGSTRVFTQEAQPAWRQGDRVKLVNGELRPA